LITSLSFLYEIVPLGINKVKLYNSIGQ